MGHQRSQSFKKLPDFNQWSARGKSQINYDDLAGKPMSKRDNFDIISNNPPTNGMLKHRHSVSDLPTFKKLQEQRTKVESPWRHGDTLERLNPKVDFGREMTPVKREDPNKWVVPFE